MYNVNKRIYGSFLKCKGYKSVLRDMYKKLLTAAVTGVLIFSVNVYAADNNIVIKGQYKSALVVGLDGKVIYRNESGSNNDNETQIPAPNDGMYIIKLDDKTFKLIVK